MNEVGRANRLAKRYAALNPARAVPATHWLKPGHRNTDDRKIGDRKMGARNISILLCKCREFGFNKKISAERQMSADGAADLRRRAAPSARTRHGGAAIDAAEEIRLRAKPAPRFIFLSPIFLSDLPNFCRVSSVVENGIWDSRIRRGRPDQAKRRSGINQTTAGTALRLVRPTDSTQVLNPVVARHWSFPGASFSRNPKDASKARSC